MNTTYHPFKTKAALFEDQIEQLLSVAGYLYEIGEFGDANEQDIKDNPYRHFNRIEDVAAELGCHSDALRREVRLMMEEAALEAAA